MTDTERKLQLTRFLREENAMNRLKMRSREEILYGSGKPLTEKDLPLVYDGHLEEGGFGLLPGESAAPPSTFGLRLALAALLFGAVLYLDKEQIPLFGTPAAEAICRQVSASSEENLIEFASRFSLR